MKDSHYRISLDIHSTQSQVSLPVKQGDTSRKVFISLCEGGKPYQIEKDCYAVFSAKKPDGKIIENYCIIADNVIEYTFTKKTTAVSGMLDCEIKLYGGESGLITSPRFTVIVDSRAVSDAEIESSSEFSALDNLYSTTIEAIANAETATDDAIAVKEETQAVKEATEAVKTEVETKLANGEFKGEKGDKGEDVNYNLVSNALKGAASGEIVTLTDVSPVEHTMKARVHGKNLIDMSTVKGINGESIVLDGDNVVLKNFGGVMGYGCKFANIPLYVGKTYTFSVASVSSTGPTFGWLVAYKDGTTKTETNSKVLTTTISKEVKHVNFYVAFGDLATIQDITIAKPMCELGDKATAYSPWLNPTTVTLTRCGASETDNPQTYTPNADGTVDNVTSLYPTTVLTTDTEGVVIDVEYNKDANKVIDELIALVGVGSSFVTDVEIYASKWVGTTSPYSQVVTVAGATNRSQVDLTPSAEQLSIFHNKDLAFVTENNNGVITVYAIGQKPMNDYTIQATVTEVKV